ncbi:rhodanese-like domain-containing protein [Dietzia sp. SYD-A1]|uniref:rhodanese-like domain-containing protein n=1 Tax=Dietzia sp. SYD-A1 TaxID=2780141 RepID=UPI001891A07F|nr:rhodanese-like domain-containing protein [Dietzia sp. SYD-A1]
MSDPGLVAASFTELPRAADGSPAAGIVLLDVRDDDEYALDHLDQALHVPVAHLADRLEEVPPGVVWVHCERGSRAERAGVVLAAAGREVVVVRQNIRAGRASGLV